jgi:pyridoxamine 5'-phosphate oxidase
VLNECHNIQKTSVPKDRILQNSVSNLRHDFSRDEIEELSAKVTAFEQFESWLAEAIGKNLNDPNAMVLSTSTPDGRPSSRVVLLKGFDENGFVFYTNYDSRKAAEIAANPHAALLFYWTETGKQVRIEGTIKKVPAEVSDEYFASRPRASQIGAAASPQSNIVESRDYLEGRFAELEKEFEGREIKRPENWGGYILEPDIFEFWQGRESRLHDRLRYTKNETGWDVERLAP